MLLESKLKLLHIISETAAQPQVPQNELDHSVYTKRESWFACGFLWRWKRQISLHQMQQIVNSVRDTRLDLTWQTSDCIMDSVADPRLSNFSYNSDEKYNVVFSLRLLWDMRSLMSGYCQRSCSDKIFPHGASPLTHPWLFKLKLLLTWKKTHIMIKKKKKKGRTWKALSRASQSCQTSALHHTTGSLAPSLPQPPTLFTFCWQRDLEVFGSALRSLGTIRQFTF